MKKGFVQYTLFGGPIVGAPEKPPTLVDRALRPFFTRRLISRKSRMSGKGHYLTERGVVKCRVRNVEKEMREILQELSLIPGVDILKFHRAFPDSPNLEVEVERVLSNKGFLKPRKRTPEEEEKLRSLVERVLDFYIQRSHVNYLRRYFYNYFVEPMKRNEWVERKKRIQKLMANQDFIRFLREKKTLRSEVLRYFGLE